MRFIKGKPAERLEARKTVEINRINRFKTVEINSFNSFLGFELETC